jgi:hypothetical protein
MRVIVVLSFLLFISPLFAQVDFEYQYDINYPTDDSKLCNMQMYDVNNDDEEDIVLFFTDYSDDLLMLSYQTNGDFICERVLSGESFYPEKGLVQEYDDELIIIGSFTEEYEIMTKVCDFETGSVIDSLIIDHGGTTWDLFPNQISELKVYHHDNDLILMLGFDNTSGIIVYETKTIRMTYDGSLSFDQFFEDMGEEIIDIDDADELFVKGYYYGFFEQLSNITRYLKLISKSDYTTVTDFMSASGSSGPSYISHWPVQFEIVTQNDNNYSDYGWMFYKNTHTQNGYHNKFINYDPNNFEQTWTVDFTEPDLTGFFTPTCIEVNNQPNYVMYFKENSLEIRNRIDGNLVHVQASDILPTDIFRTSSNELLFITDDDTNNVIKFYKLENDIFVDVEEDTLPESISSLSNYPNPFNPSTTIEFSIQNNSQIELTIYNTKGQKVKTLADNQFTPGSHTIIWNGKDESGKSVSSGIYFYKLQVNGKVEAMEKCLLLK